MHGIRSGSGCGPPAWTVNDPALMRQMMDTGVNGIVTDRPDLLRAEMQKRGLALPRATPLP